MSCSTQGLFKSKRVPSLSISWEPGGLMLFAADQSGKWECLGQWGFQKRLGPELKRGYTPYPREGWEDQRPKTESA